MFGVLRGCGKGLSTDQHQEWWGHICGLCLTLRDQHGQPARITTNFDAALLSVLYEAQLTTPGERRSSVCALRSFRSLDVVASSETGARFAAAITLLMAATRLRDHADDGDGWAGKIPRLARRVARHWDRNAERTARELGFDTGLLLHEIGRQSALEAQPGADFSVYAAPTEACVGAAFRHTAILADQPHNAAPLEQIGRMYGRMMLLLDSYRDYADDRAKGHFNALAGRSSAASLRDDARTIFAQALAEIRRQWQQLDLAQPALAQTLLLQMLPGIGAKLLHPPGGKSASCATALPVAALLPLMGGQNSSGPPPGHVPNDWYPTDQPHLPPGQLPPQTWGDQPPVGQPFPAADPPGDRGWWKFALLDNCCSRRGRRNRSNGCECCDCCYCCDLDCCECCSCCNHADGDCCECGCCCECCSCDC